MNYLCEEIDKKLNYLKEKSKNFSIFLTCIDSFNPIIIGGFIRDVINNNQTRDIDIILNTTIEEIDKIVKQNNLKYTKNSFGGYKIFIGDIVIDLWTMDNHYLFKNGTYEKDIENLKETTFINYDSLIYDLKNRNLNIDNYVEFLNSRTISFVGCEEAILNNPQIYLSITKIFKICYYEHADISEEVKDYIYKYYNENKSNFISKLKKEYLRHYTCYMPSDLENYIRNYFNKNKVLVKR